jgi:hypothetical protein
MLQMVLAWDRDGTAARRQPSEEKPMRSNTQPTSPRPSSRLRRLLAPLCLAATLTTLAAAPTLAADNNAPNVTINGYGASVGANVACDAASHTMSVSARATTLETMGWLGVTSGPYDAGQWLRYNVWARDITASEYTPIYAWSEWQVVKSVTSTQYVERLDVPQDLGTSVVTGRAGHNYQILVQVDWWTGTDNIANVLPAYTQSYTADAFNTYHLEPGYCHL